MSAKSRICPHYAANATKFRTKREVISTSGKFPEVEITLRFGHRPRGGWKKGDKIVANLDFWTGLIYLKYYGLKCQDGWVCGWIPVKM